MVKHVSLVYLLKVMWTSFDNREALQAAVLAHSGIPYKMGSKVQERLLEDIDVACYSSKAQLLIH